MEWCLLLLINQAKNWYARQQRRNRLKGEKSPWWIFAWEWSSCWVLRIQEFKDGRYQFSPVKQYNFADEIMRIWCYWDRLMLHLIYTIIKPTFKHVISPLCLHLNGPSAIAMATAQVKQQTPICES